MGREDAAGASLEEPLLPQQPPVTVNGNAGGNEHSSSSRRRRRVSSDQLGEGERRSNGDIDEGRGAEEKSRNINFILAYTVLCFAGRSLWSQSALSAFVYLLRDSNPEFVGYLTAVMGIAQLLASFPSGYLADERRRDALVHAASVVGLVAAGMTTASVLIESYALLAAALAVWDAFWGMANTSISALFADSIRDGDRSRYFTQRMILVKIGNLMGPLAALLMFALQGDSWTTRDCAFVMGAGQIVCLPAMALLCFLSDDYAVVKGERETNAGSGTEGEGGAGRTGGLREPLLSQSAGQSAEQAQDEEAQEEKDPQLTNTEHLSTEHSSDEEFVEDGVDLGGAVESSDEVSSDEDTRQIYCCCIPESRQVPALIAAADLTGGIAAGMTVRYFPIFLLDNIHLDPVRVQIVYALALILQIMLSRLALKGGERFGRCQMAAALKWSGVLCFILLIVSYKIGLSPIVILTFFIGQIGLMNPTGALTKSVLMDAVPRNERGKWPALESVNVFSWAGSAAIGGWLVQAEGIVFNFCVTAALQVVATIPLVVLFGKVEGENDMRQERMSIRPSNGSIDQEESAPPRSESLGEDLGVREGQEQRGRPDSD